MGKIKNRIREDLMKEVERKKDLLEFYEMIEKEIEIPDIVVKFNQLMYFKIDISIQLFNDFIRLLIKKQYYDDSIVINCEKFILDNSIVASNICNYLVEAYSEKGIFTDYTNATIDIILTYCKETSIINKIKISLGIKNLKIDREFIESFINYYKINKQDSFIIDSVKQICNTIYIIPGEILSIFYEVYVQTSLKEYNNLEKILFSALMKDMSIFKQATYKLGDDYIDYCNEKKEYSKERAMILLEMYKEHKICNIDMLIELLKYEIVDKGEELTGVFDISGREIISMYQKNKKVYYKVGFCNKFILRYGEIDKVVDREILEIYFDSVIMNLYRNSKDMDLKSFCCERHIDKEIFNEKLLKDYIEIESNKTDYLLLAYETLLENYFKNLTSNYDEAKIYINKYIEIINNIDGKEYKNYVKNYIISLIEDNNLDEAKSITLAIEKKFLKEYLYVITSILFKSIENKKTEGLMEVFDMLRYIDTSQLGIKSIQGLFVKYLSTLRFISKKHNEIILTFFNESSNANKREILNTILNTQLEDITLLLNLYEIEDSNNLERRLIDNFNNEDIIYPIKIHKKLIDKSKESIDTILKLSESVSEEVEIYEQIYNIVKGLYVQEYKDAISSILKNIIKYEDARLAWIKLNKPIIDIYSLGEMSISNKYLQMRTGENIFSMDKVIVIRIKNEYRDKLEKYIIKEKAYLKNIKGYYILDYMETATEIVEMNIEDILSVFENVVNIYEQLKNDNIYLYNTEVDKFIISKNILFPLSNFIARGEGHILSSREINDIGNKIGQAITRKNLYEESTSCKICIKFLESLLEEWSQVKILEDEIDDITYKKINFIYYNLLHKESIFTFGHIRVAVSKINKVIVNEDISVLSTKEKIDNFYMFKEKDKEMILNEIIENHIIDDESVKIIIDNINYNCVSKEYLLYLIGVFVPKIYEDNQIKNILSVLNIIENYSNKVLWDEELDEAVESFLNDILKNKKIYNIFIKNAI